MNGTGGAPVTLLWWENGVGTVEQGKEFTVTPTTPGEYGIIVQGTNGDIVSYTVETTFLP